MGNGPTGLFRNRNFVLFWVGLVGSQIGVRATHAATLFHVYTLTGSTLQTGLVGLFQGVALIVLSPMGGAVADRVDRRRLLQVSQSASMVVSLALGTATLLDVVQPWHIFLAVVLNTAAQTFDAPARQALIAGLVEPGRLVEAFALTQSSNKLAMLIGPALGGLVIAVSGPGLVYVGDGVTYAGLVAVLAMLRLPPRTADVVRRSMLKEISEGVRYVVQRPIIYQLLSLDLSATLFAGYRALLPALAVDVLGVGAAGYGLLSAAPAVGALLGAMVMFRLIRRVRAGRLALLSTMAYGAAAIMLAQGRMLLAALAAATALGLFDALAVTVRHSAVQLETPDVLRGRVSSLAQMASRGGPALGDLNVGALAAALGPSLALTVGGMVPIAVSAVYWLRGRVVMGYRVPAASGGAVPRRPVNGPTVPPVAR